jgi:hypothetical protein
MLIFVHYLIHITYQENEKKETPLRWNNVLPMLQAYNTRKIKKKSNMMRMRKKMKLKRTGMRWMMSVREREEEVQRMMITVKLRR